VVWLVRFAAIEGSILAPLLAVAGVAAGWPAREDPRFLALFALGAAAGVVGLGPFTAAGREFSLVEYLAFRVPGAAEPARDVLLDPSRPDLPVDVWSAMGKGPHPFVLVVHGGSWARGDKGSVPHVSRALAVAGYTVFDARYRLAPAYPFPAAVDDLETLLTKIHDRAAEFGVAPERGAILGRSAGGNLALVVATGDHPLVKRAISLYGPTDLARGHDDPMRPDVVDGPRSIEAYLGGPPASNPAGYAAASPLTRVKPGQMPILLIHGLGERLVRPRESEQLADAATKAGNPVKLVEIAYADHGFDVRPGGVGEQRARAEILTFLAGL
jgi:acetyl esterase/lipase